MVSIVSHATALCAAALVALLPQTSRADSASGRVHAFASLRLEAWSLPLGRIATLGAPPELTLPPLPHPLDAAAAGPWAVDTSQLLPPRLELAPPLTLSDATRQVRPLPGVNLPTAVHR